MRASQFNLELKNETGTLAHLCRDLASNGVNLLAIAAPEQPGNVVRLLVVHRDLAENALRKLEYTFTVEEVLFVELKHKPGALAKAVEKLAAAELDVRYVYATADVEAHTTAVVIAVAPDQLDRAIELLG